MNPTDTTEGHASHSAAPHWRPCFHWSFVTATYRATGEHVNQGRLIQCRGLRDVQVFSGFASEVPELAEVADRWGDITNRQGGDADRQGDAPFREDGGVDREGDIADRQGDAPFREGDSAGREGDSAGREGDSAGREGDAPACLPVPTFF